MENRTQANIGLTRFQPEGVGSNSQSRINKVNVQSGITLGNLEKIDKNLNSPLDSGCENMHKRLKTSTYLIRIFFIFRNEELPLLPFTVFYEISIFFI